MLFHRRAELAGLDVQREAGAVGIDVTRSADDRLIAALVAPQCAR